MNCHRIEELLELLGPEWQKDQELNLLQFIVKLAQEAGYQGQLEDLTDDVLIYHLKMRNSAKDEMIPGLKKDQEDDFKTAILKARGIIK
ncbi:protein YihD [Vibrio ponticus]|uniref:YihD family protein n=1 Tax=Vibrio rhodolitus TaxID=2231649 RepID=UPI000508815D|nr:YihD family protein [Vibrio rhodolitus]GAK87150.1 protein YihD [Vibrio ponticus]